jgi:hypothetical protein
MLKCLGNIEPANFFDRTTIMKLQEFTELLTKPLMIKMETTDIPCASVVHRQKACIGVYTGLLNVFE